MQNMDVLFVFFVFPFCVSFLCYAEYGCPFYAFYVFCVFCVSFLCYAEYGCPFYVLYAEYGCPFYVLFMLLFMLYLMRRMVGSSAYRPSNTMISCK